jgi:hypothetical protein
MDILFNGIGLGRTAFYCHSGLEMIANDVGCHDLQESEDRIFVFGFEVAQHFTVVFAKLEKSFLNQVIGLFASRLSPLAHSAKYGRSDHGLKPADKLGPSLGIPRTSALSSQFI